ncbi:MAG: HepT-like ribonuclease domain-containing protein [Sphingobium sp.]
MLLIIGRIRRRSAMLTLARFVEDEDEIDLLAYRLAMLGEAASKLSSALRERHPQIPWRQMVGLRNIVSHEYMRVTPARIWQTAQQDLEPVEALCRVELGRQDQ